MAKARIYRAELAAPALPPKVRVYRGEMAGASPVTPKVRVYRAQSAGVAAVVVKAIANQTVEPETIVTLTAVLESGGTADSYSWRRVSGPASTLTAGGATALLRAPSAMPPGAVVVIGVTATVGAVTSRETTVTITSLPQTEWSRKPGGPWVGATTR